MTESEKERRRTLRSMMRVQKHALAHNLGRGKSGFGEMPCGECPDGVLKYIVGGASGYASVICTTPKCTQWMTELFGPPAK